LLGLVVVSIFAEESAFLVVFEDRLVGLAFLFLHDFSYAGEGFALFLAEIVVFLQNLLYFPLFLLRLLGLLGVVHGVGLVDHGRVVFGLRLVGFVGRRVRGVEFLLVAQFLHQLGVLLQFPDDREVVRIAV